MSDARSLQFRVMGDFHGLDVWHRSHELAARLDRESRRLPRGYGELADQLRRAGLSIPTNVAEGSSSGNDPEFARYVSMAINSAAETESLLHHALATGALDSRTYVELGADLTIIRKMLYKLRSSLQRHDKPRKTKAATTDPSDASDDSETPRRARKDETDDYRPPP